MPVPIFPLLGMGGNVTLLDPRVVFTPLTCGLVVFSSLCGLGIAVLLSRRVEGRPHRSATSHFQPPILPKAA
ncbi:MAG TPA: hypothetical protein VNN62_12340 [Methylomirabilota bacterium]|nr:hypothetical protein [Methylomirabilota bacterium]